MLTGVRYTRDDISRVLQGVAIERYFSGLDLPTFTAFIY